MSRRLVILGVSAAAVMGFVAPSFAQPFGQSNVPVKVTVDRSNGVAVGAFVNNTPAAGVSVRNSGEVCAGLGDQVPVCTTSIGAIETKQQLPPSPVVVRHDSNGTVVAVGEVGVVISNNGEVCPRVSTQDWICVNLG